MFCNKCGSIAIHFLCSGLQCGQLWTCESCQTISESWPSAKKRRFEAKRYYLRKCRFDEEPVASTTSGSSIRQARASNEVSNKY